MTQAPTVEATRTYWTPVAWAGTGLAWLAALVLTGSAVQDVLLWLASVVLGVLLPGVALVRAVRPGGAALIEDIGWGVPAGFLVALAGWAVGVVLPWAPPWLLGPLVVLGLLAVPGARARLPARPEPGWGLRPNLVLCDVLATNRVCVQEQPDGPSNSCQAKAFTLSAVAGRNVDVGGWSYASRNNNTAWTAPQHWTDQPFWDPPRLAREQAAFSAPTPQLLAALYHDGVRWLVADSGGTRPDAATLDRLATRRLTLPGFTVWQLSFIGAR